MTTRVGGIRPGEWHITAGPANDPRERGLPAGWANRPRLRIPRASTTARTGFGPVIRAKAPGTRLASWPALVLLGVGVALLIEALLARRAGIDVAAALAASVAASLVGTAGARVWYLIQHRGRTHTPWTAGMCVQGFVAAAIPAVAIGSLVADMPIGAFLDIIAPGMLFAMVIGRYGCFFGGCCAGRPTAGRFALWSSNRRLGVRRIPVQLIESTMAAALGVPALLAVLFGPPEPAGVMFLAAIAAYTAGRQVLFPLRDEPRQTRHGRQVTLVLAVTIALAAAVTILAV